MRHGFALTNKTLVGLFTVLFPAVVGADGAIGSSGVMREALVASAPEAPFKILRASAHAAGRQLVLTIQNTGDGLLKDVFVSVKTFRKGLRLGAASFNQHVDLQAGEQIELAHGRADDAYLQGDTLIVAPAAALASTAASETLRWTASPDSLKKLSPSSLELAGEARRTKASQANPDLPTLCCEQCLATASSCGNNYLRGSCRSSYCISSYSCRASSRDGDETCECNVSCRDSESCC